MPDGRMSRKAFLTALGAAPVALTGLTLLVAGCAGRGGKQVKVVRNGFWIDGRVYPLYSGSFHYWRHDSALWPGLFDQLSRLGLRTVCTPVPWSVHELGRRSFDFGRLDRNLDLGAFLDLAREKGFKVLLQPGPRVDGDLNGCGLPSRVLFDPEIAARTSLGTLEIEHTLTGQFPVPSYFSSRFYGEAALYFDELMPLAARRLHHRGGPVIGIQVDHELSFFRHLRYPYTVDYHPEALTLYRGWLEKKYLGRIAELNRCYGTSYGSFMEVEPPVRFAAERYAELPLCLDWVEFREWSVIQALERLSTMFAERGIEGVPVFLGLPVSFRAPADLPGNESARGIDLAGIDLQPVREAYPEERELCRGSAGLSLFPFLPGFAAGFGVSDPPRPRLPEDLEFLLLAAFMHGVKGFNLSMAVERDRWLGGPITRDGGLREEYHAVIRRLLQFLRESRFHEYRKEVGTIFLYNHSLDRLLCAMEQDKPCRSLGLRSGIFGETLDLGLKGSPEASQLWIEQTTGLLREVGFDWNCGDTRLGVELLARYRVALLPTIDFLWTEEAANLKKYVEGGGILVFGPEKPRLNERLMPDPSIALFFERAETPEGVFGSVDSNPSRQSAGRLIQMESPREVGRLLKTLGVTIPFTRSNSSLDLTVQVGPESLRLLFVANGTDRVQRGDVFFPGAFRFARLWGGEPAVLEGKLSVELEPYQVAVWEVS
jgi:beta-galactosidase